MSFSKKELGNIEDTIANGIGHDFAGRYEWDLQIVSDDEKEQVVATIVIKKRSHPVSGE